VDDDDDSGGRHEDRAGRGRAVTAPGGLRRVFLFGCPRSRTTVAQRVVSQACDLATMASTNWFLEHASTQVLNGPAGSSRAQMRPFALKRVREHVAAVTGVDLGEEFRLEGGLDVLAERTGAAGWLEKTPLHLLSAREIAAEVEGARFVHLVRDPGGVVASLLRRAAANPGMVGAGWQAVQAHDEHTWRVCLRATLDLREDPAHLVVDAEDIVDDPELWARRVAEFLDLPYRPPGDPARTAAEQASVPSHRPWKADAAGPVRRIAHADPVPMTPLESETARLWAHAREVLGLGGPSA
jgi:Sulfotransferase family